jgi:DNA-binding MarR family transcriptional regulator
MNLAESIELLGKRWKIVEKLCGKQSYVTELARELGMSKPEVCKYVRELEKNGLVEHEQKSGERVKYYFANEFTKKLFAAITETARALESKPKKTEAETEGWKIDEYLNIIEDRGLSSDVRLSFSSAFHNACTENPRDFIGNKRVQSLFEKVTANPFHDGITENLCRSVSYILPYALQDETGRQWVVSRLYPALIKNAEKEDEKTRTWTIQQLGKVARLTDKKDEATEKFLQIFFSDNTDPDGELGKEVRQQLSDLASKALFARLRAKAKDQNPKIKKKAEILLEGLKQLLL